MPIFAFFKTLLATITAALLSLSIAGAPVPQETIAQIASTTDSVVAQAVSTSPETTPDDVQVAYDLGKAVGKLQAQTAPVPPPTVTPAPIINPTISPMPEPTPAPVSEPLPTNNTPVPAPVISKARLDIVSPIAGKGLGRNYVAADEITDESNYIVLGAIAYDDAGDPTSTPDLKVTVENDQGTKDLDFPGTGDVTNIYVDGQKKQVPVYTVTYDFTVPGVHIFTFTEGSLVQVVTVSVK